MRDQISISLNSLSETKTLAGCFALHLTPGLVVGLNGPLGVGKSAFARFIIQAACGEMQDVPSPTFTLVQSYETEGGLPIMHMDLYRLTDPEEVFALGIEDSFIEAANLIEWPIKMQGYWPQTAVNIELEYGAEETRLLTLSGPLSFCDSLRKDSAQQGLNVMRIEPLDGA